MKTNASKIERVNQSDIPVWDAAVRVFHWSLAVSFFGAYLIEDGGAVHQALGYIALGLVAFRLVWGFVGGRHARFSNFLPSIKTLLAYTKDVLVHKDTRYLGHNPAGAVMILALLASIIATGCTGWMMTLDQYRHAEWLEALHEAIATGTLILVGLHIAGVVFTSIRHRENLVRSMFTGRKRPD